MSFRHPKQHGPYSLIYRIKLRRLKVGEKIKIGDWCCDPRSEAVEVVYTDRYSRISEQHHPHYRIEILSNYKAESKRVDKERVRAVVAIEQTRKKKRE